MISRRTEIRQAFATALSGLQTTGWNVFVAPKRQLSADELPALLVWSGAEEPNGAFLRNGKPVQKRWRLMVGIRVKESVTAEETADQIIDEIEAALFASPATMTLGGLVNSLSLAGAGEAEIEDTLDKPALALPVFFEVLYGSAS